MSRLDKIRQSVMNDPEAKAAYEEMAGEFELVDLLLGMRTESGLTQEQVADRMGTSKSNICRLEKGGTMPRLDTLQKYAKACNCKLKISFAH